MLITEYCARLKYIWIVIAYISVRYIQAVIYIERQYTYISIIEKEVSEIIEWDYFNRESGFYLGKYPKILDLVHIFYTWIIPILIMLINILKILLEIISFTTILPLVFDLICCVFCIVIFLLYQFFMHFHRKNKHNQNNSVHYNVYK